MTREPITRGIVYGPRHNDAAGRKDRPRCDTERARPDATWGDEVRRNYRSGREDHSRRSPRRRGELLGPQPHRSVRPPLLHDDRAHHARMN
jgi:hypothetical protein